MGDRRWVRTLAALLLLGAMPARAQLSPGPLARPHAALEGTLKCVQCHQGKKDEMARACLGCHREIAALAQRNRGLHTPERVRECASCHPDHAGRDFDMVQWPDGSAERFDHRRAGWALEQSHATTRCGDCHAAKYRTSPVAALAPRPGGRWTGLETGCAACHDDVHRDQLADDCTACHDAGDWERAPRFDHDRARYRLTGAHDTVSCDGCHLPKRAGVAPASAGAPRPVYRDLAFAECSSCHADPHAGRFGGRCASCHVTTDFRRIDRGAFDHDRTRYPLRGDHQLVACARCHAPGEAGKRPAFATCASCHRADPHAGTATLAGQRADCAACHTVNGWAPGVMTLADHARTRYPLDGKHRGVACGACHRQLPATASGAAALGSARVQLRPAFAACRDCHADDHGGQLAARAGKGRCEECHGVGGWTPATFGRAEHATLRLALDGRHGEVACAACHAAAPRDLPATKDVAALGRAKVALRLDRVACAACHVDVHRGRFEPGGARPQARGCEACHDARAFRPAVLAARDHAPGVFPLEGGHRATPCVACHAELDRRAGGSHLLLAGEARGGPLTLEVPRRACADCHARENPHGDQFATRKGGGACEGCHDAESFARAARFDHDRDAAFRLAGAHARVRCAQCHVPAAGSDPRAVRYRPLSPECESCHEDATAGRRPGGKG